MKRSPLYLVSFAIVISIVSLSSRLYSQKFEGTVEFALTTDERTVPMTYMIKGDNIRVEMEGRPGMKAIILVDAKEGKSTMIMDAMKMFMDLPVPQSRDSGTASFSFKKSGKTQKLLGYDCEEYLFTDAKTEASVWITKALGSLGRFGMGSGRPGNNAEAWQEAVKSAGGFPLLTVVKNEGKNETTIKATKIEKKSLDEALFKIPEGYQKMDPSMMRRPRQ
ncbi:MAG TPA: DUF4412 domain-containing protein [Bacteroidota bacterium]|nr:DUF4412 domain-containing protein [Bacteroidota bacterium]